MDIVVKPIAYSVLGFLLLLEFHQIAQKFIVIIRHSEDSNYSYHFFKIRAQFIGDAEFNRVYPCDCWY